jgi:phage terminase large subunit-like protein
VLGVTLFPWQRWVLIHALELLDDGTYRFRTVVLLVARQNGKSTLMQVLSLWRMFVDGAPLVIGTAQNLDVAEEQWEGAVEIAEGNPELAAEVAQVVRVNGKKTLRLVGGQRYKVAAASRRGGRGLSGDLVLLDELREHHNWEAWAAVTKTTMARRLAQIWAASNAGDLASVVLGFLRRMAHAALGNPDGLHLGNVSATPEGEDDGDSLGLFEWSAQPGCSIWDRDGWAQANPSLGHPNGVTERAIASAARTDPEPVFRTEVLCQWVDQLVEWLVPELQWTTGCVDILHQPAGKLRYALDVDTNAAGEEWCSIGCSDGVHLELVTPPDAGPGIAWVVAAVVEKRDVVGELVLDPSGPAGKLIDPLEKAGITVRKVTPAEFTQSSQQFLDAVLVEGVRHLDQPRLNRAVAGAARRDVGDGAWRFSRKLSPVDIGPLNAVHLARWAASQGDSNPPLMAMILGGD